MCNARRWDRIHRLPIYAMRALKKRLLSPGTI